MRKEKLASKEKSKEDTSSSPAYARAVKAIELLGGAHKPPHPDRVVAYAETIMGIPRDFALAWYDAMTDQGWLDRDNEPIRNWTYMLKAWKNGDEYHRAKQKLLAAEAKRMNGAAVAGKSVRGPRKADNWIGTPTDRLEEVF